jgi:signal transduction histidine kinase
VLRQISDVRVQYERARQLDELKDQFITSVNHELRNPVMLLQGYVELLRLKGQELSEARRDDLIERASRAGEALTRLVQSILDTRRIDQRARDFAPETVPVAETVVAAAALVDPREGQSVERDLRLEIPHEMAVWGEKVRLQQILTNLLSNAIKYSAPGTPVEVSARVVTSSEGRDAGASGASRRWGNGGVGGSRRGERRVVQIQVRDHGYGIPPEQAPLLFQRFVRLPRDLASATVGNGLGLYVCRELAEAMGGRIWVESTGVAGEGSTFYLQLPLPSQTSESAAAVA